MNADQRQGVSDAARYLRQVRPLDPEELSEYVEGQPHYAAVRQVLREMALELALVEDADGIFHPAPVGSVETDFDGVDRLPERLHRRVEDLLVDAFGPDWPGGESGDRLRERIRAVKARYLRGAAVDYDELTALGYAVYHLPATYAAARYVLADLFAAGELGRPLRVLDVGAGVGGPALALCDCLPDDALVEYHAVEPSAAADVLDAMLETTGPNVHPTIHRETAEAFDPEGVSTMATGLDEWDGPYLGPGEGESGRDGETGEGSETGDDGGTVDDFDLVLFGNVLSELDDPAAVLERYLGVLAPHGSLVAIAPADRNTATNLRRVERAVADDGPATVYAPTVRLWPGERPTGESWSFAVRPDLETPAFQRRLDEAASGEAHDPGEFVNDDVQYSYSVLRLDGTQSIDVAPDRSRVAKMADAESAVTQRVDLLAVKLSADLSDGGNPLFLIGDGSQDVDHFAVLAEETTLNADLRTADYGALLSLENALVLWNDDEAAYNVVVDGEAIVERAA